MQVGNKFSLNNVPAIWLGTNIWFFLIFEMDFENNFPAIWSGTMRGVIIKYKCLKCKIIEIISKNNFANIWLGTTRGVIRK